MGIMQGNTFSEMSKAMSLAAGLTVDGILTETLPAEEAQNEDGLPMKKLMVKDLMHDLEDGKERLDTVLENFAKASPSQYEQYHSLVMLGDKVHAHQQMAYMSNSPWHVEYSAISPLNREAL